MVCLQVKVQFNAEEALGELQRLGQLQESNPRGGKDSNPRASGKRSDRVFEALPAKEGHQKLKAHWDKLLLRDSRKVAQQM